MATLFVQGTKPFKVKLTFPTNELVQMDTLKYNCSLRLCMSKRIVNLKNRTSEEKTGKRLKLIKIKNFCSWKDHP